MATYINLFLKSEITVIPRLLDKYVGNYYNNGLCNGATWMFLLWYLIHVVFDNLLNALLRRMKYKEYVRIRLKRSLWYLGFYSSACFYSIATLLRNDIQFHNMKTLFYSTNTPPDQLVLGFILLATFYLHSAFWEWLKYCYVMVASRYLCLFFILCLSYLLRFVESSFRLTILVCFTQIALELARCLAMLIRKEGSYSRILVLGIFFTVSVFSFVINYGVISIFLFTNPIWKQFSPSLSIFLSSLTIWLILELFDSVSFKAADHYLHHKHNENCGTDIFECSLFPPRNDATYNLLMLRKEIKEREQKCLSLRKPKNRAMVMQTLKCMMAIKRKINEKRRCTDMNRDDKVDNHELSDLKFENPFELKTTDDDSTNGGDKDVVDGILQFNIADNNKNERENANHHNKCKED